MRRAVDRHAGGMQRPVVGESESGSGAVVVVEYGRLRSGAGDGGGKSGDRVSGQLYVLAAGRSERAGGHVEHRGAWGIAAEFYQADGQVKFGMIQPEFKEFVETMHRWYKNGLIDQDFAITNRELQDARMTNHELGTVHSWAGSGLGAYLNLMKDDPEFQLIGVQPPSLRKGEISPLGQVGNRFVPTYIAAVTTKAAEPEKIVRWLDFAYGPEGHMLFNFGVEGLTYEMVDGYPKYTDLILNNPDGLPVAQAMASHFRASWGGPFVQDMRYYEQYASSEAQKEAIANWAKAKNDIAMPTVTLTAEESETLARIMSDVNTYADEMVIKMIMGAEPIDKFDQFVNTLIQFGVEDAVAVQQAALDRYNNR
jgi:putative aldouronate transport system substrate-binding protein